MEENAEIKKIKRLLLLFIMALFLSGFTAIPIDWQLQKILPLLSPASLPGLWLSKVLAAYSQAKQQYPYLLYGYDWLAFAHFILAILFIGPYQDPVKNSWVIKFGLIASLLVVPLALIAGYFRSIPFWWRLVDCSFGVLGFVVLWICYRKTLSIQLKTNP